MLDTDDSTALYGLLSNWTIKEGPLTDREKRTVGYALQTEKPHSVNEEAPSFPPTSLTFQTYPYIAAGEAEGKEGIPDGDNNMLLYLQMTDNRDFPPDRFLQNAGNFINAGMDGTMCIERGIFWDRYLLRVTPSPILRLFNPAAYVWVKEADLNDLWHPHIQLGMGDLSHKGDTEFFDWVPLREDSLTWTWGPDIAEQHHEEKRNPGNGHEYGSLKIDCELLSSTLCTVPDFSFAGSTSNNLTAKAGSNVIEISGKSDIKVFDRGDRESVWLAESYDYT